MPLHSRASPGTATCFFPDKYHCKPRQRRSFVNVKRAANVPPACDLVPAMIRGSTAVERSKRPTLYLIETHISFLGIVQPMAWVKSRFGAFSL